MKKMYLWEVEYQVSANVFGASGRGIKVVTDKDSYGEAERVAILVIKESLKDSNFEFLHLTNISPSEVVYTEEAQI